MPLSDDQRDIIATLKRINWHYGNGIVELVDFATGTALVRRQYGNRWYRFTVLPDRRVRFRNTVRSIGFTVR